MARASEELRPGQRAQLEDLAESLHLSEGRSQLLLEFQDGRLVWFQPTRVRVPASRLDEELARAGEPEPAVPELSE